MGKKNKRGRAEEIRAAVIEEMLCRVKEESFFCDVSFGYGQARCAEVVPAEVIERIARELAERKN